jgi:hypothetical protein
VTDAHSLSLFAHPPSIFPHRAAAIVYIDFPILVFNCTQRICSILYNKIAALSLHHL